MHKSFILALVAVTLAVGASTADPLQDGAR